MLSIKKHNILHVIEALSFAGMEQIVIRSSNHMNGTEFQVQICAILSVKDEGKFYLNDDINLFSLEKQRNDFSRIIQLIKILHKQKIKIVHSHNWGAFFIARIATMFLGIKHIHCEHGFDVENPVLSWSWKRVLINKLFHPDIFIGVSKNISKFYKTKFLKNRKSKVVTIPNGIDTKIFYPKIKERNKIRKSLKIDKNTVVLITVALPRLVKNIPMLIDVVAKMKKMGKNIHLIHIGDDMHPKSLLYEYKKQANNLNIEKSISFLGFQTNISDFLSASDIYVNCSSFEGTSCSILEGMGCGLPVIASNVGGNPDVVENNHNGILFDIKVKNDLMTKIIQLVDNKKLRAKYSLNSLSIVNKKFDILKGQISSYRKLYLSMVQK